MTVVHVVLPHDIDDLELSSGGNVYDRRLCLGLAAAGELQVVDVVRQHHVHSGHSDRS